MSSTEFTCGAAISSVTLCIVTLQQRGRRLELLEDRSALIELRGREQADAQAFLEECTGFCDRAEIRTLQLRGLPSGGKYAAAPLAYKAETLLQIVPNLLLAVTPTMSVGRWIRVFDPVLPSSRRRVSTHLRDLQRRAIETAAFQMVQRALAPGS